MKIFSIIGLFFACMATIVSLNAQTITMQGFYSGSATQNNLSIVLGQPFNSITAQNGYEVTEGLVQAQLVRESYTATVTEGQGYTGHGFQYAEDTPTGTYNDSRYDVHVAPYGYDVITNLVLIVKQFLACGDTVYDGDSHPYPTVSVAGHCWTKKNLYPEHYTDQSAINGAMVYHSQLHPNEAENLNTYGRLYTWAAATNSSADGTIATDDNGYVQGICPDGWHIPTAEEMAALNAVGIEDLRTAEQWVTPNSNTNSTDFTALPAGMFDSSSQQFIGLHTQTDWWSVSNGTTAITPASTQLQYYCDTPTNGNHNPADGLSVRCVKNEN